MEENVHSLDSGTEGGRRPNGAPGGEAVQVAAPVERRRLTISYKIRAMVTMANLRSEGAGSICAFLRKEGLNYSTARK